MNTVCCTSKAFIEALALLLGGRSIADGALQGVTDDSVKVLCRDYQLGRMWSSEWARVR
jgi:hypothetical protein